MTCEALEARALLSGASTHATLAGLVAQPLVAMPPAAIATPADAPVMNFSLLDNTQGPNGKLRYGPNKVYFAIIGQTTGPNPQFAHVDLNGNLIPMQLSDNGALKKDGIAYSNYFFTANQIPQGGIPVPVIDGARVYISLGSPLYIRVNTDAGGKIGYTGPDLNNPHDPNYNLLFDKVEFNTINRAFFGNATQVDFFGLPMTLQMDSQNGTSAKEGVIASRSQILKDYMTELSPHYQALFNKLIEKNPANGQLLRIMAPKSAPPAASVLKTTYFDAYIRQVWTYYQTNPMTLTSNFGTFTGKTSGPNTPFVFRGGSDPIATYQVGYPTTLDAIASLTGVFNTGNAVERSLEPQIAAAINRGVALTPPFTNVSAYYPTGPNDIANYFAGFWHKPGISIGQKAYGFDYDDVNRQEPSISTDNPKLLTVAVGI